MFLGFNSSQEQSTKSTKLLSQIVRLLEAFQLRLLALSIMLREGGTRARGSRSLLVEAPQHRKVCAVRHFEKKIHPLTTVNIMDSNRRDDAKTGCRSCFGSHLSSGHSHCWGEVWAWASCLSPQLSLSCRQSFSTGHKASG